MPGGLKGGGGEKGSQEKSKGPVSRVQFSCIDEDKEIKDLSDVEQASNEEQESIAAQVGSDGVGGEGAETTTGKLNAEATSDAAAEDDEIKNPEFKSGVQKGGPSRHHKRVAQRSLQSREPMFRDPSSSKR